MMIIKLKMHENDDDCGDDNDYDTDDKQADTNCIKE